MDELERARAIARASVLEAEADSIVDRSILSAVSSASLANRTLIQDIDLADSVEAFISNLTD